MRRVIPALLVATLTLSGCGMVRDSWVNPMNWFGRSEAVPVEGRNPLIPETNRLTGNKDRPYGGVPVEKITDVAVERVPGGALIRVTGVASRQGAWDVRLVARGAPEKGVLSYDLMAVYPSKTTLRGPEQARTVTAALRLTDQQLDGVRQIRALGETNARASRR